MSSTPRASVVVIARNEEDNIGRAIRSVIDQASDVEVVVVDDNSDDETLRVASSFPGVRADRNPGVGMSDGLNHGIALARSDLIIRLDADDWHLPGSVEALLAPLERDRDVVVVGGSSRAVDTTGRLIDHHMTMPSTDHMRIIAMVNCPIEHTACAFRRGPIQDVGGYQPTGGVDIVVDLNLWIRLLDAGAEFVGLPSIAAVHVISPSSVTNRRKRAGFEAAAMLRSEFRRRHAAELCTFSRLRGLGRSVISWRAEPVRSDQFAFALVRLVLLFASDRDYRRAGVVLAAALTCGPFAVIRGAASLPARRWRRRRAHGWGWS